ncbi:MAG TPA: protein kinase [Gemmatimonadaceae bacterium]|nr:protein kinase [Gemmatimonadaceae bacterium]
MSDPVHDRLAAAIGAAYDVEQEIGRGGMGVVYRALDLRLKRHVAIKVLPPDLAFRSDIRKRFLREAETAARLNHPNIVPIYTVDECDGLVFFVMGLVQGESLGARLLRDRTPPVDEVRTILHDVADALAYAHAHGVIHRDIKPDNILLDVESGRPMVTDFGIARAAEADSRLTMTGMAMGSPAYMSPEQATGDREIDGRSDLYALGVVGYQMLAGGPPFKAANSAALMMKQINERPRPLREMRSGIPPGMAVAIDRALEKRPEDRWPDAAAFRDALAASEVALIDTEHRAVQAVGAARPLQPAAPARPSPLAPPRPAPMPQAPVPPVSASNADWQRYREEWLWYGREQRRLTKRQARRARRLAKVGDAGADLSDGQLVERRIILFRRNLISQGGIALMLAGINAAATPHFPWFIFPTLGMGMGLVGQWSRLWAEGITWRQIWKFGSDRGGPPTAAEERAARLRQEAQVAKLLPREVRGGPYAAAVRRAVEDRAAIVGIVESLSKADRALLPDVVPTVDALVDRTASLAQMLHRLDADLAPGMAEQIEARIAAVTREPSSSTDRERRLSLLERQRQTLQDLTARRDKVAAQLDSAGLALQNLRLDLLKLRSSGVQAAIGDVNNATVEARALSRDIAHALEAADELRKL